MCRIELATNVRSNSCLAIAEWNYSIYHNYAYSKYYIIFLTNSYNPYTFSTHINAHIYILNLIDDFIL